MNLLIVDDESMELDLLERLIGKIGFACDHIYRANCMEKAVEVLKKHPVDIAICDIEMPGGSGHELTEWIRERDMEVEVIFSTGHADFDYATMALRLGASDYLLKPVKKEDLKKALEKARDKRRKGKEERSPADGKTTVQLVKAYIREHCGEDLSRTALAERYFIHPNYLSHIFREETSLSLQEYITFARMEKAKSLLVYSDLTVSEIALQVGYSNTAYFIRHFKREMNQTPKQYRKQERAQGKPAR